MLVTAKDSKTSLAPTNHPTLGGSREEDRHVLRAARRRVADVVRRRGNRERGYRVDAHIHRARAVHDAARSRTLLWRTRQEPKRSFRADAVLLDMLRRVDPMGRVRLQPRVRRRELR